ncbi:unnamed protein product [Lathyrus sativus]|nr:unnamed protein product [Lathyrus sativus]
MEDQKPMSFDPRENSMEYHVIVIDDEPKSSFPINSSDCERNSRDQVITMEESNSSSGEQGMKLVTILSMVL